MSEHKQGPLAEQLFDHTIYPQLLEDSKSLVNTEIEKKGFAIRTAFNMAQKAKPDLVQRGMEKLLPEFVQALEPFYAQASANPDTDFHNHLLNHRTEVANALLLVSDRRVDEVNNRVVKSGYKKLRGKAEHEVVAAMPGIADVMSKYAE